MDTSSDPSSSTSTVNGKCFYCEIPTTRFRQGWQLRNGNYAALCNPCGLAYEEGRFCLIFHLEAEGWRACVTCEKPVHCGCVASIHTHQILECGGVKCMECLNPDSNMATNQYRLNSLLNATSEQHLEGPSNVITEAPPLRHAAEEDACNSNIQNLSEQELQQITRDSDPALTLLFEKTLTSSDTNPRNGRLVVPKKCAEAHFPKINKGQEVAIDVLDTEGNEWKLRFRCWANNNDRMYVLEGLKDVMIMMQWKAGDIVSFYRIEPEGKMIMAFYKANQER